VLLPDAQEVLRFGMTVRSTLLDRIHAAGCFSGPRLEARRAIGCVRALVTRS